MNNDDYVQKFPIKSSFNYNINEFKYNENIQIKDDNDNVLGFIRKIDAEKLWKKIIHNAWKSAEPGILFWDKVLSESIPDCYADLGFETKSTNPCVSYDTPILTDKGYKEIGGLVGSKVNVWNGKEFSEVEPMITGEDQPMLKIVFSDGSELKCTDYHGFYTWEGYSRDGKVVKKEAKDLNVGDKLEKYDFPVLDYQIGESFKLDSNNFINEKSWYTLPINNEEYKKYVPKFDDSTLQKTLYWLAGIIDSDGSRNSSEGSISISSIDRDFLSKIKLNVLNTLGVNGSVIDEKEGGLKEINGVEYNTNKSYRLIINASNVKKLYNLGLRTHRVKIDDVNPNRDASRFITVESIERIENADKVYCFTEHKRNRGCFNGVVTSQCGEITLTPYDSCRLLVLNLYGYVVNPFSKDAYFNWNLFKSDVVTAQRYMDDIIDLEIEKIDKIIEKIDSDPEDEFIKMYERNLWEKIKEKAILGRRTGLGITAEGDMLASLGFIYGTDKATDFSESVHERLKIEAYRSSVELAKERGAFPIYDSEREIGNPFIERIKNVDPKLYEEMVQYGRRNIALLTIAPVGTTSLMSQTSSGIEPVFLPVYKRRRKINTQEKNVKIDFVDDEGQGWVEYTVFHHKFKTWLEVNGYNVDEVEKYTQEELDVVVQKSPYYKATSNDVDWVKKVEMQGRIQQHIDHSISVTVNLPNDVTEETVSKVYETGWRSGCKGITVYRDGSRSGVLIGNDKKEEAETVLVNNAPKRPKRLKGEIHRFNNNYEKWIAVIGIYEGRPYELFTGKLENGLKNLPLSIKDCEIVQKIISNEDGGKFKRYDMEYVDGSDEKHTYEGLNFKFNPEFWNYSKLISGIFRHGMPTVSAYKLIESLSFREEHINTWKNGVVRAIKKYIKDGEKTKGQCPNCGTDDFVFQEGCLICQNCGFSLCS